MSECIFCAIVAGDSPAEIVHQDDQVVAFADKYPNAKLHLVVVPKAHIASLDDLSDPGLEAHLLRTARALGNDHSPEHGYRITVNGGSQQDVGHLHFHVLGGQPELGPPAKGVISS